MAYRKKRTTKRRYRKKRVQKQTWAQRVINGVVKMGMSYFGLNAEHKRSEGTGTMTAVSNSGTVLALSSGIAQGTTALTRTGDSVKLTSVHVKGDINWNTSATGVNQYITLIWFADLSDDGSTPTGYTPASTDLLATAGYNANKNLDNNKRYAIIKSKTYTVNSTKPGVPYDEYIPLNIHCNWKASGTKNYGHIYMLAVSNVSTINPSVVYSYRIRFIDN